MVPIEIRTGSKSRYCQLLRCDPRCDPNVTPMFFMDEAQKQYTELNSGSRWHRWEPHIHAPLVGLFLDAKTKRQVIMVTHNANLVVNTDADQIIVAQAGPHRPGQLPPITYLSGGLESNSIRKAVCDILEGGERAFQERARRLRVRLER